METVISVRCNKTTQIFSSLSTTSQLPCPITFSFETGTSQIPHLTLTRVLEGSPLTLTLSLIHTLNVVVSQTACLRLWPEKNDTCMFNNAITIFRPCGFSTYTMLYLWSPWFVCHIEQEHRYAWHCCCSSEQRRYAGSYCLLQLSCTSTVTLYVHLINVTTLCSSHLVQWGTLTVIHLSHACGIPSLTSSLCHTRLCSVIPLLRPMWCITTLC